MKIEAICSLRLLPGLWNQAVSKGTRDELMVWHPHLLPHSKLSPIISNVRFLLAYHASSFPATLIPDQGTAGEPECTCAFWNSAAPNLKSKFDSPKSWLVYIPSMMHSTMNTKLQILSTWGHFNRTVHLTGFNCPNQLPQLFPQRRALQSCSIGPREESVTLWDNKTQN